MCSCFDFFLSLSFKKKRLEQIVVNFASATPASKLLVGFGLQPSRGDAIFTASNEVLVSRLQSSL